MQRGFLLILASLFIFLWSCGDDSSTNPVKSDVDGTWKGQTIIDKDTARYTCEITSKNGLISGNGDLYGFHKSIKGTSSQTIERHLVDNVDGIFATPDVKIKFVGFSNYHFEGQLSENKMSIEGQLKINYSIIDSGFNFKDTLITYFVTLNKQ
ncbi:MAG: hypothetical protein KIT33_12025 [Candidatus Kapabacteria bacterium]|nr:hypothetical protein [Ignavibacteriota bacterium]MCW5885687.1 hypothetical protein [Candidatus Kapabacteria bacterium]